MTYVFLVCGWLAMTLAGMVYLLIEAKLAPRRKMMFVLLALASVAVKIVLADRGHNYDMDSFQIVAALVLQGKSVYANTTRYNYAPVWGFFLAGLKQLSLWLPLHWQESFHITIAAFLAVTDVAIAGILATTYSYRAGLFFLCSPVILMLTGFHSQFENMALLVGLLSWLLIRDGNACPRRLALAAVLEGLSLVVKHILFLFPLWVLFWPKLGNMRKRLSYASIAYALFGLSFLPWVWDPASRAGIFQNVFRYRSGFWMSLVFLIGTAHPFGGTTSLELTLLPLAWTGSLVVIGLVLVHTKAELFPMYLLAMFALSPALADHYLAIPILACAILHESWTAWGLTISGIVALLLSDSSVLRLPVNAAHYCFLISTQVCALVSFNVQVRAWEASAKTQLIATDAAMRAFALALCSAALVFIVMWVRL